MNKYNKQRFSLYEIILICGCLLAVALMYIRAFYGTEITDEAFYVSDALGMIQGNIPYAYNNFSYGTGAAFLLIPQLFVYKLLVPDLNGVFLFTRLSYVTFRFLILLYFYHVLRKKAKRSHALLCVGILIPFWGSVIQNYSYNTVPIMLSLLSGLLIYDAIEQEGKYRIFKMIFSGFSTGIAVFAHPGYGISLFVFLPLILLRSNKGCKVKNLVLYCLGGIAEIVVVLIPIIVRVGWDTFAAGIKLYIHPYPSRSLASISKMECINFLLRLSVPILFIAVVVLVCAVPFGMRYIRENEEKLKIKNYIQLGISIGIFANIAWIILKSAGFKLLTDIEHFYLFGLIAAIYVCIYVVAFKLVINPLFYYLAIYPVMFSIAEVLAVDSGMSYERFYYALPALSVILLLALENESELVRMFATMTSVAIILVLLIVDYQYVYLDEPLPELNYKVEDGVYAGIYTTEARANDLVELEQYLNSVVEANEYFAFRDNVPCGYLMMHDGKMCDVATWDVLQYMYHGNTPAKLFDYYKRRDAIPNKIIYVDYGWDKRLSIEDSAFRYNDFVNEYYTLIDDVKLNDTFSHVMVYEYNNKFDGDYDYWINTYMGVADTNNEG